MEATMYKIALFTDGKGREVKRLTPLDDDAKDMPGQQVLFRGRKTLFAPGLPPVTVEFGLSDARSLKEAFQGFDAALDAEMKEQVKRARHRVVGPDGRPLPA